MGIGFSTEFTYNNVNNWIASKANSYKRYDYDTDTVLIKSVRCKGVKRNL